MRSLKTEQWSSEVLDDIHAQLNVLPWHVKAAVRMPWYLEVFMLAMYLPVLCFGVGRTTCCDPMSTLGTWKHVHSTWCHNRNYQGIFRGGCKASKKINAAAVTNLWIADMWKGSQECSFHPHIQKHCPIKIKSIWFAPVPGQNQHDRDLLRHHAHLIAMGANAPASCRALVWHGAGQKQTIEPHGFTLVISWLEWGFF